MILLAAGFSFEGQAAEMFDIASIHGFDAEVQDGIESSDVTPVQSDSLVLFAQALKDIAESTIVNEFGFHPVHGQPLPGVLLTLLLGAAFGLARRKRASRHFVQDEQSAVTSMLITARLFRLNILLLNPPTTIHTISPGPDLFCQRE